MNLEARTAILEALYRLHDGLMARRQFACRPGCHTCCTRDLTATTLEGWYLLAYCAASGSEDLAGRLAAGRNPGLRPAMTINALARACLESRPVPEEEKGRPDRCPLLVEGRCAVYPARPLGCRAMVSAEKCRPGGEARMDPFVLTFNTVFQQVVEQLDVPGFFGNLADVIRFLKDTEQARAYREGRPAKGRSFHLLPNRAAVALMVPPEHRAGIRPVLESLQEIFPGK